MHAPAAQPRRLVSFSAGFALGIAFNLAIIAGLVYLKVRDTSVNPWETLTFGAFGAVACISPVQLAISATLGAIRSVRSMSLGLVAAGVLGVVALVTLAVWSNEQANIYGQQHGLA